MRRFLIPAALALLASPAVAADRYVVDYDRSAVKFIATQSGREFTGEFEKFTADITFSAEDLAGSTVVATIDLTSVDAGSGDRNDALPGSAWFNTKKFPNAVFAAKDFARGDEGRFVASGSLSLKGVSRPVVLPFTLTEKDGETHMVGKTALTRTDFNVGSGQWASGDTVGLEVEVIVELVARKAD